MNMKTICIFLVITLFSMIGCCKDDDVLPICFDKNYYEEPWGKRQSLNFNGGSENLSVMVSDTSVLEASVAQKGILDISTKRKGVAYVTVKDNANNGSARISIKVVDKYLCMHLADPVPQSPDFRKDDKMFMINNKDKSVYIYDDSLRMRDQGRYNVYIKEHRCYMSLDLSNKNFVYDVSTSDGRFFGVARSYLGLSKINMGDSKVLRSVEPIFVEAIDTVTNTTYYFTLDIDEMPLGVL